MGNTEKTWHVSQGLDTALNDLFRVSMMQDIQNPDMAR